MRDFSCPKCAQRLTFENSLCLSCGSGLGFDPVIVDFVVPDEINMMPCANLDLAGCNCVARPDDPDRLCPSCALTRTRPGDSDVNSLSAFLEAEAAKRRLLVELLELGLPVTGRDSDPVAGLCFDLLSSEREPILTGHFDGVVTLDLAEGDAAHREQLRVTIGEPYRTLLGHFRHETGHYYFEVLVYTSAARSRFEQLFGDPEADYQAALERHYSKGPPLDWAQTHVSAYASMHPAEDWAETFAHYLHIRDTLDTAAAFGLAPAEAALTARLAGRDGFERIIELWLPLSWSLNMINRSMGRPDLYPFVLPPAALEKMRLAHDLIAGAT